MFSHFQKNNFIKRIHPFAYQLIPFALFGWLSVQLILANEPDWFARLGSLIVAWAIFYLSRSQSTFNTVNQKWEHQRTQSHLVYLRKQFEADRQALELTFDIHACQHAQIAQVLQVPNPFCENDAEKVESFCRDVQKRLEENSGENPLSDLSNILNQFEERYARSHESNTIWLKTIWWTEFTLLIWGTIQWGYGDLLVDWIHS
ncbi:hypothetical protein [Loktanella sp. S4079]|uniref:hypothetical protein n=1 Tax=Loktanella sp. S4079 TaxID=579483 RepID=UPI0005F9EB94|nr:hypothetical protein [Loktanella sp. S4079]KJZ20685.1 hypothetical protein TW80_07930 [Loktanella sp. S4079]